MKQLFFLFLFFGFAAASANCDYYPYKSYAYAYYTPPRPPDTLLDRCSAIGLSDPQICAIAQDGRISEAYRKGLILSDFVKNNGQAPISEAASWNNNLPFNSYAPDGVSVSNSQNIKGAWIRFAPITPLVYEPAAGKYYSSGTGSLTVRYAFTFVVPRQTFQKDCRTEYDVCGYDYTLDTYHNGQKINWGNGQTASFNVPTPSHDAYQSFSTVLRVKSQYLIHHYKEKTVCWRIWSSYYCTTSCDLDATENHKDELAVSDGFTAYAYYPSASARVFVDRFQNGLVDGWLQVESGAAFNALTLRVVHSALKLSEGQYRLEPRLSPYNVLTPVFDQIDKPAQTRRLSILSTEKTGPHAYKIHFLAQADQLDCKVDVQTHFRTQTFEDACDYNEKQKPVIELEILNATNQTFLVQARFYDNATNQSIAGKSLTFAYGNLTSTKQTDFRGLAVAEFNRTTGVYVVTANFTTDFETKSAQGRAVLAHTIPTFLENIAYWIALALLAWAVYHAVKRKLP